MSTWPPEETVELKLPSGAKMQARLPDKEFLGICGMAIEMGREERGEAGGTDISDPQVVDIAHAMGAVLTYCCANPSLSLKPQGPHQIHPDSMPIEDAFFIVQWGLRRGRITISERGGCVGLSERSRRGAKVRPNSNQKVN